MSDRIEFPNEPIRPKPGEWDFPTSDEQAELEGDPDDRDCWTCCGEGFTECTDDDCFHAKAHLVTCPNCRGSGDAKDVWYW